MMATLAASMTATSLLHLQRSACRATLHSCSVSTQAVGDLDARAQTFSRELLNLTTLPTHSTAGLLTRLHGARCLDAGPRLRARCAAAARALRVACAAAGAAADAAVATAASPSSATTPSSATFFAALADALEWTLAAPAREPPTGGAAAGAAAGAAGGGGGAPGAGVAVAGEPGHLPGLGLGRGVAELGAVLCCAPFSEGSGLGGSGGVGDGEVTTPLGPTVPISALWALGRSTSEAAAAARGARPRASDRADAEDDGSSFFSLLLSRGLGAAVSAHRMPARALTHAVRLALSLSLVRGSGVGGGNARSSAEPALTVSPRDCARGGRLFDALASLAASRELASACRPFSLLWALAALRCVSRAAAPYVQHPQSQPPLFAATFSDRTAALASLRTPSAPPDPGTDPASASLDVGDAPEPAPLPLLFSMAAVALGCSAGPLGWVDRAQHAAEATAAPAARPGAAAAMDEENAGADGAASKEKADSEGSEAGAGLLPLSIPLDAGAGASVGAIGASMDDGEVDEGATEEEGDDDDDAEEVGAGENAGALPRSRARTPSALALLRRCVAAAAARLPLLPASSSRAPARSRAIVGRLPPDAVLTLAFRLLAAREGQLRTVPAAGATASAPSSSAVGAGAGADAGGDDDDMGAGRSACGAGALVHASLPRLRESAVAALSSQLLAFASDADAFAAALRQYAPPSPPPFPYPPSSASSSAPFNFGGGAPTLRGECDFSALRVDADAAGAAGAPALLPGHLRGSFELCVSAERARVSLPGASASAGASMRAGVWPLAQLMPRAGAAADWSSLGGGASRTSGVRSSPFIGLVNQGATCYMNGLLQQLFMTPAVRRESSPSPVRFFPRALLAALLTLPLRSLPCSL